MSTGVAELSSSGGIIPPASATGGAGNVLQASTPVSGVALSATTPQVFATWTPPNDGKLHRFIVHQVKTVSAAETGGYIQVVFQAPDGTSCASTIMPGQQGTGFTTGVSSFPFICRGGIPVTVQLFNGLTLGASVYWCEIWGS